MKHEEFWEVVNAVADAGTDPEAKCDLLKRKLSTLAGTEVFAFSKILTEYRDQAYRWDIWAIAHIVGGGCSDDAFDDFRHSQIFRGRKSFERLLANPDSMADESFEDIEYECFFEGYQYIPDEVCEEMTNFQYPDDQEYVHPKDPVGTKWTEAELPSLYPQTWAKYGDAD